MAGVAEPSLLAGVRHNALALGAAGDLAGARDYLDRALESARPAFGEDHPEVLETAQVLAGLHRDLGDSPAARRVLEEALATGQLRLGEADPLLLAISFDLGMIAEELGNRHEARRNLTLVATWGPSVLGPDHWQVRAARDYLDGASLNRPAAQVSDPFTPAPVPPPTPSHDPPLTWPATEFRPVYPPAPAPPPPPAPAPAPVPQPTPAVAPVLAPAAARTRGLPLIVSVGAATAAVLAALVVVVVGMAVLIDGPNVPVAPSATPDAGPGLAGEPPTGLRITDDGSAITITWSDPTAGTVPFIVAGGRGGQVLGALATVNPGQIRYTVNGLNPDVDYCFTVLAVYSAEQYATSGQVCTARVFATPR